MPESLKSVLTFIHSILILSWGSNSSIPIDISKYFLQLHQELEKDKYPYAINLTLFPLSSLSLCFSHFPITCVSTWVFLILFYLELEKAMTEENAKDLIKELSIIIMWLKL